MTDKRKTNSYKLIKRVSSMLFDYIVETTLESDSRHSCVIGINNEQIVNKLVQLFNFDPTETKHRLESVIIDVLMLDTPIYSEWFGLEYAAYVKRSYDRVRVNVDAILDLLFIYQCDVRFVDIGALWNKFLWLDLGNELEDYLKFQTASYLAKMMKQDIYASMPPVKKFKAEFFLVGSMNKFLRKKLFSHDIHFGWSVCQSKRGMSPLRGVSVLKNLRAHKQLLSTQRSTPPRVLREVERTVRELFNTVDREYEFKLTRPSPAACYELTRQSQGCIAAICGRAHLVDGTPNQQSFGILHKPHHIEYYEDGVLVSEKIERPSMIDWLNLSTDDYFSEVSPIYEAYQPEASRIEVFDETDPVYIFNAVESRLHSRTGNIPATVVALSEPFKTRIITKSMADANYYAKPLQQVMHKNLRKNKIFTALDRPLVLEDFVELAELRINNPSWKFVSGDYSAATDNINSDATISALYQVMEKLDIAPKTRVVLAQAVANQEITYFGSLKGYENDPDLMLVKKRAGVFNTNALVPTDFDQQNGQLMGSILSFPLLCMINAAMFRMAVEEYYSYQGAKYDISLKECEEMYGLRVNGDDILFCAPDELIEIWSNLVAEVGLILSLGKNYVHPNIFTINSQMIEVKKDRMILEHNYVNLGLFKPDENEYSFFRTCDKVQQRLYKGQTGQRLENIHEVLIYKWSPILRGLSRRFRYSFNWYLPRHVGGLGLQSFEPIKATIYQRRIATALLTRSSLDTILKNKFLFSERVVDPVLVRQLDKFKKIADQIGYELTSEREDNSSELLESVMSRYIADFEVYDPLAQERSLVKSMIRKIRKLDESCGSLKPMRLEKILFSDEPQIRLNEYEFEVTDRLVSYPRCRYDDFDDSNDGFRSVCPRNVDLQLDQHPCYWTSLGYQRSPDNGLLTHLVGV